MSSPFNTRPAAHRTRAGATAASAMLLTLGLVGGCGPRRTQEITQAVPCEGTALVVVRNQTAEELEVVALEKTSWTLLGIARIGRTEIMLSEPTERRGLGVRTQQGVWVPTVSDRVKFPTQ